MNSEWPPKPNKTAEAEIEAISPVFKTELPGREAPDHGCLQASIGMILDKLEGQNAPTYEELVQYSRKKMGQGTWPGFLLSWLKNRGYQIEVQTGLEWNELEEQGEQYLNSNAFIANHETEEGENYGQYLRQHDLTLGIESFREMANNGIPINNIDSKTDYLSNIQNVLRRAAQGEFVVAIIDGDHYAPITGFDGEHIFYNNASENDVEVDKKIALDKFLKKWKKFGLRTFIMIKKQHLSQ